jgi:hypothetical protein
MSSDDYVSDVIKNVEGILDEANPQLCVKVSTPMTVAHRPELDTTQLQSEDQADFFQNLTGALHLAVEQSQTDIHVLVTMLSSYLVQRHQGCMQYFTNLRTSSKYK